MGDTKEDCDKSANENWRLMREFERMGDSQRADDAARRAIEDAGTHFPASASGVSA